MSGRMAAALVGTLVAALMAGLPAALSPAAPARAGARGPTIASVDVSPFVARIGDRMTLTIVVEHESGITVAGPSAAEDFGGLDLVAIAEPMTAPAADGGEKTTLVYTLAPFQLGTDAVPPLEITWRGPGIEGTIATPAAPFTVDASVAPDDDSILPLKAQIEIPQPAPPPFVPAMFVAVMAGLTALGYWLMRRAIDQRPPELAGIPAAPQPTPAEVARVELDALAASGALAADPAAYYGRLSAIVRQYLSAQYGFAGYAMTRREIEAGMHRAGIDRWPARLTANLLEQGDAAQFARFRPAMERREQDLTAAYEIVDVTGGGALAP